jgi:saccharopine dehydrogenase-like NADP-dependent oxidoreductase
MKDVVVIGAGKIGATVAGLLRLPDRRDVLKDILEHAVPTTLQDVVIIFVTVSGHKKRHLVQETYANKSTAATWTAEY